MITTQLKRSVLLAVIGILSVVTTIAAQTLQIVPVNIVSPVSGEILRDRSIVIKDGRIANIVPASGNVELPVGVTQEEPSVIDGRNGYVIPGLAEMHAHVPDRNRGEQYTRDILTLFLANGVTTIRGMLGAPWHLELRDLLERQQWPGPHLITSGPSFNGNSVSSPAQAAQRVRDQVAAGYDFLKLHPGLKAEEFTAIARTAKELNTPFAGHVSTDVGIAAALQAQQATIDHLDGYAQLMVPASSDLFGVAPTFFGVNLGAALNRDMAHDLATRTAAAGVWNVPTQSLLENIYGGVPVEDLLSRPAMNYVGVDLRKSWTRSVVQGRKSVSETSQRRFIDARRKLIFELQQAGAELLLGSDAPQIMNVPGFSVHEELEFLVSAGLTPLQALQSGTTNPARFFSHEDRGQITRGMLADLVLLESNPLENISATRNILGVIRGGTWYSRSRLDAMLKDVAGRGL